MNNQERRDQLKEIMTEYNVSIGEVALILERSSGTVRNWRSELGDAAAPPKNELR